MPEFSSFPEQASAIAGQVDQLLLVLFGFGAAFFLIVLVSLLLNIRKRQEDSPGQSANPDYQSRLQIVWAIFGVVLLMALFVWSEQIYLSALDAPDNAKDVAVVGKRWMWKFQSYPDGQSEIDELHVVVNEPVKLTMTSQDVIHSLSIPAFRVQKNVIPGRYTTLWFWPTEVGEYDILSSEYDGTGYTKMVGRVIVTAKDGAEVGGVELDGEELWAQQGCAACHIAGGAGGTIGPSMDSLFGKEESLESGDTALVDDDFLRESILDPMAKVAAGFPPAMPPYAGTLGDAEVDAIIDYIKTLSDVTLPEAEEPPAEEETPAAEAGESSEAVVSDTPEPTTEEDEATEGGETAPSVSEEDLKAAQTLSFTKGCVGCHGTKMEGLIGPIFVGLDPDYMLAAAREGRSDGGMPAYTADQVSDEDMDTMAQTFGALALADTGVTLSQPVLDALAAAQEALDAGDKAGVETNLQAALDAASDAPDGVKKTLAVMIANLALDDWADYVGNRLALLLGT